MAGVGQTCERDSCLRAWESVAMERGSAAHVRSSSARAASYQIYSRSVGRVIVSYVCVFVRVRERRRNQSHGGNPYPYTRKTQLALFSVIGSWDGKNHQAGTSQQTANRATNAPSSSNSSQQSTCVFARVCDYLFFFLPLLPAVGPQHTKVTRKAPGRTRHGLCQPVRPHLPLPCPTGVLQDPAAPEQACLQRKGPAKEVFRFSTEERCVSCACVILLFSGVGLEGVWNARGGRLKEVNRGKLFYFVCA